MFACCMFVPHLVPFPSFSRVLLVVVVVVVVVDVDC